MNAVDAAIVAVTLISSLFGLWRGLIREVLSLLTWVAALVVARIYSEPVSELLAGLIGNSGVRYVTAFALIFIAVMMVGTLLTHLMSKLFSLSGLKLADRVLGALFGVLRGVVIVLLVLFVASAFVSESPAWQRSTLIPYGMAMIERSQLFIEDANSNDSALLPGQP